MREIQTSVWHNYVCVWGGGAGGVLQQLNSNQHRNRGRCSSLHFPWVRLLQRPQLSDTFSSPFHGWWGDSQLRNNPISSPGASPEIYWVKMDAPNTRNLELLFSGDTVLFFPPERAPRQSPKHIACFETCCGVSLLIRADSK